MLLFFGFSIYKSSNVVAQGCSTGSVWGPIHTPTTNGVWLSQSGLWGGEYFRVNVTSGCTYEFSTCTSDGASGCINDTQLTLRTDATNAFLAFNDDAGGSCGLRSRIVWTATLTGTIRVYLHQYNCATAACGNTVVFRQVSCPGGGGSGNVVPYTGTTNLTTCSATVRDHGGTGNYSNNADGNLVICPSTSGQSIQISFTEFNVESGWDFLY
ncbi:MAG: hypothetical protein RML72_12520, partial [Bacteroidia bacterium]|nr:hypothetical protein [Bacteroidia bacterium]